ncbi:hypothetical protein TNCV_407531 [Trichonephila clavipes]|nr:hypothetical protein TNCV_407531 [Trichonephila clavipes]
MQLYMISPMFMIALMRWPKFGYTFIGIVICVSLFSFITTYRYNLVLEFSEVPESLLDLELYIEQLFEFATVLYSQPTAHLTSYAIGILLGYYWYKRESSERGNLSKVNKYPGIKVINSKEKSNSGGVMIILFLT